MAAAEVERFVRKERGVNAAEDDPRAALARDPADLVAAQRVARMDADADDVARRDGRRVELLERFVDDERVAEIGRRRRREHVEPAGRNDGHAKRDMAWIDEVDSHVHQLIN